MTGWEYYPGAIGDGLRAAATSAPGVPLLVTENGIATADNRTTFERTVKPSAEMLGHIARTNELTGKLTRRPIRSLNARFRLA